MKQVYMPSMDELYIMQSMGINLYKYILAKAIESIIMDIKVYKQSDSSILENIYKYLKEDPYISYSICKMYPEEIKYSEYAKNDISLCLQLMSNNYNQDKSIYNLDNLSYFEEGFGVLNNTLVIESAINTLIDKLPLTPQYRFEYKENTLLDCIFNCEIPKYMLYLKSCPVLSCAQIEPAYLLKYNLDELDKQFRDKIHKSYVLNELINKYANRYGIKQLDCNEYNNVDILSNPDTNVKRLFKCINQRKLKK